MMNDPAKTFIQRLPAFEYVFDGDPRWELVFSNEKRKWFYLVVSYYQGTYYISELIGGHASIQVDERGEMVTEDKHFATAYSDVTKWPAIFSLALAYLDRVEKDWVSEFRDWMEGTHPKRRPGGHPWEILCGGNTTHISLYVSKDRFGQDNQYEIRLQGNSIVRIAETLKIYLGLMDKQLTVAIDEPEKIRKRLLGQDSIGIVPEYLSLHRAQNLFDGRVDDVMHLYHFGKAQKEIRRLASWEELPCLRPRPAL